MTADMCFRVTRCFCFDNLKSSSFAIGVYTAFISLFSIVTSAIVLADFDSVKNAIFHQTNLKETDFDGFKIYFILCLVFAAIFFLISLILLLGVKKDSRLLVIPWLIWMVLVIQGQCYMFVKTIIVATNSMAVLQIVIIGILIVFNIYCYSCVYSYYKTLSETEQVGRYKLQKY